jgi:hypothetical protein
MGAAGVLHRLQQRGVQLRIRGTTIVAAPREVLTDELRALIRKHKPELINALKSCRLHPQAAGDSSCTGTPVQTPHAAETRMGGMMQEFEPALRLGCLMACARCQHFEVRPGDVPDGWCARYQCETWSRVPFRCEGYRGMQL